MVFTLSKSNSMKYFPYMPKNAKYPGPLPIWLVSKLLTPINRCQHRMLWIECLYYLHIPSDLPPRVLWPHIEREYSWHYYTNLHSKLTYWVLPRPSPSAKSTANSTERHCASLVRALCRADRFTNIGHPGHSSTTLAAQHCALSVLHFTLHAVHVLCVAHSALCITLCAKQY